MIFEDRIVEKGFRKAFKGDWGGDSHTKRPGIVQTLNRLSYFSFMCQLRKTNLHIGSDGAKIVAPRLLNGTQYGLLCPIHSPDGGNVGLHKHLSTSVHITNGIPSKPYIEYLRNLNMLLLEECSIEFISNATKIFLNGAWIGVTVSPIAIVNTMKLHRRNNIIYIYTSILFDIKRNEIQIWVDAGRPCRPLFYIENGKPSYMNEIAQQKIKNNSLTWNEMICGFDTDYNNLNIFDLQNSIKSDDNLIKNQAIVDYIDASEGECIKLAKSTYQLEELGMYNNTHVEIHPSLILGFMANQIIFPEHNPYPRNAFSCGQSKQGVSLYHSNFRNRIDKSAFVLNYGQLPLTRSRYLKYFTNEEQPYGENAIVAIMCYSGYNVEDAVIINKGSIERGLFNTTYFNMYEDHEESTKIGGGKIDSQFMNIEDNQVVGLKEGYDYSKLDLLSGLIKENTIVNEKTIVIGKANNSILEKDLFIDSSVKCKKGQTGIVDKSFISEGELGQRIAKVRIRATRIPDIGDKFCSRAGQKGTIGIILPEEDMPCTANGLKPDIIVNPHAMPSRMTIGHIVEALISKAACLNGNIGDCTAFVNKCMKEKEFGKILTDNGYHNSGNEVLYNGMTGEQLETEIYIGPTYYLRLKHMPKDKINYRARGPRSVLTRQTVGGRANNGGLRIGEMDRDCLLAHGMASFIKESMIVRGDKYFMAICNKSGTIAIYNETKNLFLSPFADGPLKFVENVENNMNIVQKSVFGRDFSIVCVPYAFKLLLQELKTMNVQMRIITEDNVDHLTSLFYGEDFKAKEKTSETFSSKDYKDISNRKIEIADEVKEEQEAIENQQITLPDDPLLLKEMLEKFDPYMNVTDLYFSEGEWDIEGMKSDINIFKDEMKNKPLDIRENEVFDDEQENEKLRERQSKLSDNMDFGSIVMIWKDGKILDENYEIMGATIDGRKTVRNIGNDELTTGEYIFTIEEKYIITRNSSLRNPDALVIKQDIDENKILDSLSELDTTQFKQFDMMNPSMQNEQPMGLRLNTIPEVQEDFSRFEDNNFENSVSPPYGSNTPDYAPFSPEYDPFSQNDGESKGEIPDFVLDDREDEEKETFSSKKIDLENLDNEQNLNMLYLKEDNEEDKEEDKEVNESDIKRI